MRTSEAAAQLNRPTSSFLRYARDFGLQPQGQNGRALLWDPRGVAELSKQIIKPYSPRPVNREHTAVLGSRRGAGHQAIFPTASETVATPSI